MVNTDVPQDINAPRDSERSRVLNNKDINGHISSKRHWAPEASWSVQKSSSSKIADSYDARSILIVREHGKLATCLREATSRRHGIASLSAVAKAGGFFQQSQKVTVRTATTWPNAPANIFHLT